MYMSWFNYLGLIFVLVIIIPNIIFALKNKDGFKNTYLNKIAIIFEQIGRYGCMFLMVFNIPYTWLGFYFPGANVIYIVVNTVLVITYCLVWLILWQRPNIVRALLLSFIPAFIFLFSGIMLGNIPLFVAAIIFSVTHILISVKNGIVVDQSLKIKRNSWVTVITFILSLILLIGGTYGSILGYQISQLSNLDKMSVAEMLEYDCVDKNNKISVAIIENDNVTLHTYGANGEEDAIYDYEIGSISKTFVGLLCAKAVHEGKLSLTDDIAQYLDLPTNQYYPTLERLLTHTAGYAPYYFEVSMLGNKFAHITNDFYGITKAQILAKVKSVKLVDKDYPFVYSNFGITVVGLVLEQIYGQDFTELMNEYIQNELNLSQTVVAKQNGNLTNYWRWGKGDGYIPAGSIISNINDMANYMQMYLKDDLPYASQTISNIKEVEANNPTYEKMNIRIDSIGMTWLRDDKNGIIWHNGGTTNFNSYLGFTQDKQKGVVILSNLSPNEKIPMTVIGAKILTAD